MQNFDLARQGQRAKKVHRRVSCPSAGVETNRLNAIFELAKGWLKLHRGFWALVESASRRF